MSVGTAPSVSPLLETAKITKEGIPTISKFLNLLLSFSRPYACKFCNVKYYRKYQLVKHLSSKHPGV